MGMPYDSTVGGNSGTSANLEAEILMKNGTKLMVHRKILGRSQFAVHEGSIGKGGAEITPVAVKVLPYNPLKNNDHREIRILRTLKHPNIVVFFDAVESRERQALYLVMEIVRAGPLTRFCCRNCQLLYQEKLKIIQKFCNGVCFLHDRLIFHRDIKPENILVSDTCEDVKLCDFGLADQRSTASTKQTRREPVGTCLYLAPDVCEGIRSLKTDIWSVGMTMAFFITGQHPFEYDSGRFMECNTILFQLIKMTDPNTRRVDFDSLPGWNQERLGHLASIVKKTLSVDHTERPSAMELHAAVAYWLSPDSSQTNSVATNARIDEAADFNDNNFRHLATPKKRDLPRTNFTSKKPHLCSNAIMTENLLSLNATYGVPIHEEIKEICNPLDLSDKHLKHIMKLLEENMEEGLSKENSDKATVKMLPTYVHRLPNGTEKGNFLTLDLGRTNFRIQLVRLEQQDAASIMSEVYRIPHEWIIGTQDPEALFDHIAICLKNFNMKDKTRNGQKIPLGFIMSFPCKQMGLTTGKVVHWTFKCKFTEEHDIVTLLRDACKRAEVDIGVVALLNDTTGTLMACAQEEPSCKVGVIVGAGTNACYMEKIARCPKLELTSHDHDEMIINTEWGAFGEAGNLNSILTEFDRNVDLNSMNPGKQLFEKMISGEYMGELVRLMLISLCSKGLVFDGAGSQDFYNRGSFPTKFVAEIECDSQEKDRTFANTFDILQELGLEHISPMDCVNVAYVCSMVSRRATYLCAAGIAVLLNRMQKPFVTVAVDCSHHPTFRRLLEEKIWMLIDPGLRFQLMHSEDGNSKGAALVAAIAGRQDRDEGKQKGETVDSVVTLRNAEMMTILN